MAFSPRWLVTGLVTGLFLAVLLQQIVSTYYPPVYNAVGKPSLPPFPDSMAQVLRNTLQAARRRAWAGGYKSPASLRPTTPSLLLSSSPTLSSPQSIQAFSTTTATMSASKSFADAIKERRTYYQLNKEAPISDKQITEIAEKAILHVPSSFNSQSTRLVVLLNKDHDKFWDFVLEVLKPLTPEEQFPKTEQKIGGFKAAKGTVSLILSRIVMARACCSRNF